MPHSPNELLNYKIGKSTVGENLQRALANGAIQRNPDGCYELAPAQPGTSAWISVPKTPSLDCQFLMGFLFNHAYGQSAVPVGCRNCYKVSVTPQNLSQLMALKALQRDMNIKAKCGVEVDRVTTQNIYSGFFYCNGLDGAREVYHQARQAIDAHPKLGPEVSMGIKRGCTEYELHCGPSDEFTFAPELEVLEAHLSNQFKRPDKAARDTIQARLSTLARWIQTAFRIGDNTYLEFTGGRRLYPKTVAYATSEHIGP